MPPMHSAAAAATLAAGGNLAESTPERGVALMPKTTPKKMTRVVA